MALRILFRGKNETFSNCLKSDPDTIYSRAPLHIQKLSLGQNHVYPYSIRLFESNRSKVEVANCASGGRSQSSKFSKFQKSDCARIYSRAPLHIQNLSFWLKDLYPYSIRLFRSDMSKVKVAFSSSEVSKSDQIRQKSKSANILTHPFFTLDCFYSG